MFKRVCSSLTVILVLLCSCSSGTPHGQSIYNSLTVSGFEVDVIGNASGDFKETTAFEIQANKDGVIFYFGNSNPDSVEDTVGYLTADALELGTDYIQELIYSWSTSDTGTTMWPNGRGGYQIVTSSWDTDYHNKPCGIIAKSVTEVFYLFYLRNELVYIKGPVSQDEAIGTVFKEIVAACSIGGSVNLP